MGTKRIGMAFILTLLLVAACGMKSGTKGMEESPEEVVGKETGGVSETVSEETHIKRALEDGIKIDAEVVNPLGRKAVPVYGITLKTFLLCCQGERSLRPVHDPGKTGGTGRPAILHPGGGVPER